MLSRLALVTWKPDAPAEERADLLGRIARITPQDGSLLKGDLPPNRNGGDLLWRLNFASRAAHDDWLASHGPALGRSFLQDHPAMAHCDQMTFESVGTGGLQGDPPVGMYRVLALAVNPGTPADLVARFEQEMLAMPSYVHSIQRWNFARVVESSGALQFTHVWEQEFADLQGFRGEYMDHPYHWGHLDRWYDADNPARIIHTHLCNSFCTIDRPTLFATVPGVSSSVSD